MQWAMPKTTRTSTALVALTIGECDSLTLEKIDLSALYGEAVAHLESAIQLMDQLELSYAAARADHALVTMKEEWTSRLLPLSKS
jgi:hypothetical protein